MFYGKCLHIRAALLHTVEALSQLRHEDCPLQPETVFAGKTDKTSHTSVDKVEKNIVQQD